MSKDAAALVEGAKEWASLYGDFANGEEGAVLTAPLRLRGAWDANDADAFADLFVENGSMLVGDEQLTDKDGIRDYMSKAFAGGFKGSKLSEKPLEVKLLNDSVAVAIMEGGIVRPGDAEVPAGHAVRSVYVVAKRDGDWHIVSHQTSPIGG
ncbi:SgcJ/EcaC family oxidoreductase [Actinomadura livida]|uniref:SgcJ/EcaC family oxidoreductase n=1 Tax=Actinomadura livida TaxID=79909 RepID=A0A7W7MW31_9ACTN|nr:MULTISPECIES: SgcJ/EcaC family oxidoreductase [Actinomadura]MBB4772414.1 uncharacterized protein (TIGR02246 family) [Actinomadura catellatispora]GGU23106.1 hypothetical protein GCM10010208_55170 [Actinomadura livida]